MDFTNPDGMKDLYQSIYLSEETLDEGAGLYANIHAKRARGERPARPGEKDYPAKDAFKKAEKTAKEEFDVYDAVLEYLCVEGYAETLEQAEWIMANQLTSEDIEEILEAQKPLPTQKMQNRRFYVNMKTGEAAGSSRNQKIDSVLQAHKKDPEGEAEKAKAKSKYRG